MMSCHTKVITTPSRTERNSGLRHFYFRIFRRRFANDFSGIDPCSSGPLRELTTRFLHSDIALRSQKLALSRHKRMIYLSAPVPQRADADEQAGCASQIARRPNRNGLGQSVSGRPSRASRDRPRPLLKQAGLSAAALSRGTRIPVTGQIEFLGLVSVPVADDWIGLTLAADFDLREMGMLYYVAASSPGLATRFNSLERYVRLGNEALRRADQERLGLPRRASPTPACPPSGSPPDGTLGARVSADCAGSLSAKT